MEAPTAKPWWKEREFIGAVLVMALGAAFVFTGEKVLGGSMITAAMGSFAISRGIAKAGK